MDAGGDGEDLTMASPANPLVSVIIPAYNAERLVRETIDSVLGQTYPAVEIIVVDDGSKDGTAGILKPLADAGTIRYIQQENQGQAAARRNGFLASKGTFVSFLDADDLIAPEKIAAQMEYLAAHPDCGVCYSDIYHFWHHAPEVMLHKKLTYYSGYIFDKLIRENVIQVATALIRRDALEKYGMPGPEFRRSDDWYLWLNLARNGVKFCFMPRVLAFQRRQKEGTLSDQRGYFKETAQVNLNVYRHYARILSEDERKKYDLAGLINGWQFRKAIGCVILGDRAGANETLREFRVRNLRDAVKLVALRSPLAIMPAQWVGNIILALREWRKRASFAPVANPEVKLPVIAQIS